MIFKIVRTSQSLHPDEDTPPYPEAKWDASMTCFTMEVKTLEELIEFARRQKCEIVFDVLPRPDIYDERAKLPTIEIYDSWRE